MLDIRETLSSTIEVLNYVAEYGVKKFTYMSSSTVYGTMNEVMRESSAHLQPISFYGAAKLAGEAFASAFSSMYGIQVGNELQITMREVAEIILNELNLGTKIIFSETATIWAGDVERYRYDVTKLRSLGWAPKWNTREAVHHSI